MCKKWKKQHASEMLKMYKNTVCHKKKYLNIQIG